MISAVLPTYNRAPFAFVKGEGSWLTAEDGSRYLDLGAGIAVNALWPRTTVATAAIQNLLGGEEMIRRSRHPAIMADAALAIFRRDSRSFTGHFCVDDEVLAEEGVTDFTSYAVDPSAELAPDFFL